MGNMFENSGTALGAALFGLGAVGWAILKVRELLSKDKTLQQADEARRDALEQLKVENQRLSDALKVERERKAPDGRSAADAVLISSMEGELRLVRRDLRRTFDRMEALHPGLVDKLREQRVIETSFGMLAEVDERIEPKAPK